MLNFDFKEEYILEDDFVKLSPLKIEHVDDLIGIANETDIWKYSFEKGNGIDNLTKYIQSTIDRRKEERDYPFVVFDKIKNRYAGSTRYLEILPGLKAIRLGYTWYGKEFRGTGLNKHCKYLLFEFAFEKMGAERIGLAAYIENKISIAAMESVGCKKEGFSRAIFPALNGIGRTDAVLLSILKNEWHEYVKYELKNKLNPTPDPLF
ncbi:GNAT family N-acetyltransferase [Antarcticibacterium flavum]|uniref:GNAT family N-acetyltransferase n=1 Tax=Antarcticibacterium flavum TaxID=2058175 RepID=A0A5B7X491_9FLAO|nr:MULTISPECIES: GNAT family N-acetyltransferase [Antarcticibacterium]MCM4159141.1 N-acetyltransferase [Antarcticibacterium sp. W02-3]QCY69541.1 GNAT family N-acetyltransferase [Antarcticibacterium flavum]